MSVFVNVGITIIIAQGVYVITGLTGLFSLGQSSFVAVGAYTAGFLATRFEMHPLLCILAGIVVSILVELYYRYSSLRLRHVYFSWPLSPTVMHCRPS